MFKKVEALNKDTHQNLRFTQIDSFEFASSVLNAPLSASEFLFAARYYPIVFSLENATPQALFTLGQQKNHYVNTDGLWSVPYIPAHIRRYPFILANTGTEESGDKFAVCIDVEAPHFATDQGTPLFTADGNPGDFTQKTMTFLQKFQEELKVTQALCMEMESMKVLVEKKINIEKDGQKNCSWRFQVC